MTQHPGYSIEVGQVWSTPGGSRAIIAVHLTVPMVLSTVKYQAGARFATVTRVSFLYWVKRHGAVCS